MLTPPSPIFVTPRTLLVACWHSHSDQHRTPRNTYFYILSFNMATAYLSPLAPAFTPSMEAFDAYGVCICNDGVPSLSPANVHEEASILSGIDDDALDEYYPPTAQEAAEIEAAELFVFTMACLDLLEEQEEHARADIGTMLPKRWAARRGLSGKPRPARSDSQDKDVHHALQKPVDETRLVPHQHRHRNLMLTESRERTKAELNRMPTKIPKQKRAHYRMPIQQPSKFS